MSDETKKTDQATKAAADAAAKQTAGFAFDSEDSMEGFEQLNGSVMAIPFLKTAQKLSKQIDKNKPEYIEGLEEGMIFNSTTGKIYGRKIKVVVLKYDHIYIEWKPNRGGLVDYHSIDNAERIATDKTFGKWKHGENELVEYYVYLVLVVGHEQEGPMILSYKKMDLKAAQQWNRLMMTHVLPDGTKAKPYYLVWNVSMEYQTNDQGSWYGAHFKLDHVIGEDPVNDQKLYFATKGERKLLPARKVDYAMLEDDSSGTPAQDEPAF